METLDLLTLSNKEVCSPKTKIRIELGHDSWVEYFPGVLTPTKSMVDSLLMKRPDTASEIVMFGKKIAIPRRQRMYGEAYSYSGVLLEPEPETPELVQMALRYTQKLTQDAPYLYKGVLVNWYSSGSEYIGAHSDDERDLTGGPIYSFSFGASRVFRIREKTPGKKANPIVLNLLLNDDSLVVMGGKMQTYFQHEVPKSKRILMPRINMTVRSFDLKKK